jgi:hypothetical protein
VSLAEVRLRRALELLEDAAERVLADPLSPVPRRELRLQVAAARRDRASIDPVLAPLPPELPAKPIAEPEAHHAHTP